MQLKLGLAFFLILILTACSLGPFSDPSQDFTNVLGVDPLTEGIDEGISNEARARSAVLDFYDTLNQGEYEKAVLLYGASYEMLQYFNPEIDPEDSISLLKAGCEFNGVMCLRVLEMTLIHANDPQEFVFDVAFANPDGSLFELGPCCGATEEEMPPVSGFTVHVSCALDGTCRVLDLPPYVP